MLVTLVIFKSLKRLECWLVFLVFISKRKEWLVSFRKEDKVAGYYNLCLKKGLLGVCMYCGLGILSRFLFERFSFGSELIFVANS